MEFHGRPSSVREIQQEQKIWSEYNFGEQPIHRPFFGMTEELGELAHALLKSEQGIRNHEGHDAKAKDAFGDLFIYMMDFANKMGWDAEDIFVQVWMEVRRRNWKKDPDNAHKGKGLDK